MFKWTHNNVSSKFGEEGNKKLKLGGKIEEDGSRCKGNAQGSLVRTLARVHSRYE